MTDNTENNEIEFASIEDLGTEAPEDEVESEKSEPIEDDIPEKYKGKSIEDVIAMHQNSEKLISKHGQEVGELRKSVDQLIQVQLNNQTKTEDTEEVDFYDDPEKAVAKAITNHPTIKQLGEHTQKISRAEAIREVEARFPKAMDVVASDDFQNWVSQSPIRVDLLSRADTQLDVAAALELLETWEGLKGKTNTESTQAKEDKNKQLKEAGVTTSASTEGGSGKKTFRRADIVNLMQNNRSEYMKHIDEIKLAYQEGRVI